MHIYRFHHIIESVNKQHYQFIEVPKLYGVQTSVASVNKLRYNSEITQSREGGTELGVCVCVGGWGVEVEVACIVRTFLLLQPSRCCVYYYSLSVIPPLSSILNMVSVITFAFISFSQFLIDHVLPICTTHSFLV